MAYQQFRIFLYLTLICLVHVAKSFFSTAEAGTNTAHCMYLRADLFPLQLIVVMYFCIKVYKKNTSQPNWWHYHW